MQNIEIECRPLRAEEITLAKRVFGETLPYNRIFLVNHTGTGNRPFTQAQLAKRNYYLHVGQQIFFDATSTAPWSYSNETVKERRCDVFIHELTHVWQGEHQPNVLKIKSHYHQPPSKNDYRYHVGANWNDYDAEQQAQIIEDWFNPRVGNENTEDSRYRYIIENIRTRNPR
jgi:hypothetical protein